MTTRSIRLIMAGMAGLILSANAQNNLITNPGFESSIRQPTIEADVHGNVNGWNAPYNFGCYVANTPDLMSAGTTSSVYSVPFNIETRGIVNGVPCASPGGEKYIFFRNSNERIFTNLTTPLFMHRQYTLSVMVAVPLSAEDAVHINPSTPPSC